MRAHTITPLVAVVAALGAMALGCSSTPDGGSSPGAFQPGSSSGGGSGSGGGDDGGVAIGSDGGPVIGPDGGVVTAACTAADLVAQTQCGAGKACDVLRHMMTFDAGTGGGSGGGGGDGGGGGHGDGGGGGMMGDGGGSGMGTGVGNETLICRATTTSGTEGVACNAADPTSCAAGYTCGAPADGTTDSVCYKFCNDDSACTAPGGWCHPGPLETAAGEGFTAKTCTLSCDPMAQKGCGTGEACNLGISDDRSRLYTNCLGAGTGGYQAACNVAEDCKAGFSCLKVSVNGGSIQHMCLELCTVTPASTCSTGQTCQAIAAPNTLGSTQYGWCY